VSLFARDLVLTTQTFTSPNKEVSVDYTIRIRENGLAENVAAFRRLTTTLARYVAPLSSRGLAFSWSPSSEAVLIFQFNEAKDMTFYLARVGTHVTICHIDLEPAEFAVSEAVASKEGSKASAPRHFIETNSIHWESAGICTMKYIRTFLGADGSALLHLDFTNEVPVLTVTDVKEIDE
jgi:hypothetical protein